MLLWLVQASHIPLGPGETERRLAPTTGISVHRLRQHAPEACCAQLLTSTTRRSARSRMHGANSMVADWRISPGDVYPPSRCWCACPPTAIVPPRAVPARHPQGGAAASQRLGSILSLDAFVPDAMV